MKFEELLKLQLRSACGPDDLYNLKLQYELEAPRRGQVRLEKIAFVLRSLNRSLQRKDLCLDLGCGTGSALFPMRSIFKRAIGVDISFISLLLAKKRFQENGIDNVMLICASVENLPFKDGIFDLTNATDVIEHIRDQEKFLREAYRVLRSGGYFYFNSPNRFNIFGPEPHVNLWGVGFLPRRWMRRYVQIFKNVDYKGKKLLSYIELRKMLKRAYGKNFKIFGVILDKSKSLKGKILQRFPLMLKIINTFLKPFIPGYQVIVFRDD